MKILVVDDSSVMRKLIRRSIRQAGFGHADVVEAGDGAEAIEVVQAEAPDVVLADWNMPVMTGIEMLTTLRSSGNETSVGFLTSESTTTTKAQAREAGASFYLTKPIDPEQLSEALEAVA